MEQEKDIAIANEDYDAAKQYKYQIQKLTDVAHQIGVVQEEQPYASQHTLGQADQMSFQHFDEVGNGLES